MTTKMNIRESDFSAEKKAKALFETQKINIEKPTIRIIAKDCKNENLRTFFKNFRPGEEV